MTAPSPRELRRDLTDPMRALLAEIEQDYDHLIQMGHTLGSGDGVKVARGTHSDPTQQVFWSKSHLRNRARGIASKLGKIHEELQALSTDLNGAVIGANDTPAERADRYYPRTITKQERRRIQEQRDRRMNLGEAHGDEALWQ